MHAACAALRDAAHGHVEPDDKVHKWISAQLSLHGEAIALDDQHGRWHHLGNNLAARIKADATGVSIDGVAKALVNLDKAVEQALQMQLEAPTVRSPQKVKAESQHGGEDVDFGRDEDETVAPAEVTEELQGFYKCILRFLY